MEMAMNTSKITVIGSIIVIILIISIPTIYKVVNMHQKNLYRVVEEVSNPVTKEVYNKDSYVKVEGNTFAFVVVD